MFTFALVTFLENVYETLPECGYASDGAVQFQGLTSEFKFMPQFSAELWAFWLVLG